MKRSEPIGKCGCQLVRDESGLKMIDCPLHKSALELLEACKRLMVEVDQNKAKINGATGIMISSAIAKAEGRE